MGEWMPGEHLSILSGKLLDVLLWWWWFCLVFNMCHNCFKRCPSSPSGSSSFTISTTGNRVSCTPPSPLVFSKDFSHVQVCYCYTEKKISDRIPCSSRWPQIHYVANDGLELLILFILGLHIMSACTVDAVLGTEPSPGCV